MKSSISIDKCSIICNDGSTVNKRLHQSGTRAHPWPERSYLPPLPESCAVARMSFRTPAVWRRTLIPHPLCPGLSGIVQPSRFPGYSAHLAVQPRSGGGHAVPRRAGRGGGRGQRCPGGRASRDLESRIHLPFQASNQFKPIQSNSK